jgi:hypothetical protein
MEEVTGMETPLTKPTSSPQTFTLESPELFINRELNLLEFQKRVLHEAQASLGGISDAPTGSLDGLDFGSSLHSQLVLGSKLVAQLGGIR